MKKILMLFTGGTIASVKTERGLEPLLTAEQMFRYLPDIRQDVQLSSMQVCNLDSTNMDYVQWQNIARAIEENYDAFDGFVVCHGTDTMAYTAAALSYLIQNSAKPIVLTGSQQPIQMEITDARKNLQDSICYAADEDSHGVCLIFDGKVIIGTRARKVMSFSYHAFSSINFPEIASMQFGDIVRYIPCTRPKPQESCFHPKDALSNSETRLPSVSDSNSRLFTNSNSQNRFSFASGFIGSFGSVKSVGSADSVDSVSSISSSASHETPSVRSSTIFYHRMNPKVYLLKLTPGIRPLVLPAIFEAYDCIIVESFGVGGLPDSIVDEFCDLMNQYPTGSKIVIMTTQVTYEGSNVSAYEVGRRLKGRFPYLEACDMTIEAVFAKIMWILGMEGLSFEEIEELFYREISYDILVPRR
ncbi:MAG: asparaginase [Lachnospiraceae bacterium]|nr:asparaginase [Lachnospiraceae bacterium]